ncbi:MAG: helix-turn-helix domain-containing protein [Bacteroidota bacterium]
MKTKDRKWKSDKKLPKILRINRIKGFVVSVLFSDGHNRLLDFEKIFKGWKVAKKDAEYKLFDLNEFRKVKLENFTLTWNNIKTEMQGLDGKKLELPYQIGADILYELSEPDVSREHLPLGALIRKERMKAGLTQEELAERIGADKHYISRIEADRFHIEISTLRKIIEGGLHKKLEIKIK